MNNFKFLITFLILSVLFQSISSCKKSDKLENKVIKDKIIDLPPNMKYGFNLNDFIVKKKKIKRGDTFGSILEENFIDYPEVHKILQKIKTQVSVKKLQIGKPYTLLFSKDSIKAPKIFIYQKDIQGYTIVQLRDSIYGLKKNKPVRTVQMEASGTIESSLYQTMLDNGYNEALTYYLSDIYAWTIDFFRLQKGDRFKIIYTEKFVDDTISIGIKKIKAASFEHKGQIIEAYEFQTDSTKGIIDYFDQYAKNLRRAFLKAPVSFGRVSSRYNLKRRISFYGRVKPHKGTDFAAAVGTPIMTTANGTVVKSSYSKGNGNYVTIKHNNKYSTQYLHMRKRKVKVGQYVKQGDVIGWVGMTGYTSGPHVCYRFWKNGRQVDPFKQKLPEAKPISKSLKNKFLTYVKPIKNQLNCIVYN
ncbi:MAG: peptidoglycan DD-metalloendopeptidase family protein [Flavobacteriaceae bacterium]